MKLVGLHPILGQPGRLWINMEGNSLNVLQGHAQLCHVLFDLRVPSGQHEKRRWNIWTSRFQINSIFTKSSNRFNMIFRNVAGRRMCRSCWMGRGDSHGHRQEQTPSSIREDFFLMHRSQNHSNRRNFRILPRCLADSPKSLSGQRCRFSWL